MLTKDVFIDGKRNDTILELIVICEIIAENIWGIDVDFL